MADNETFTISGAEAKRLRRGAFLPILLIVPMALMFGLDSSKSQPMHLLMTCAVAAVIGAVIVSMGWLGAKRRIEEFARTKLSFENEKMIWTVGSRITELNLKDVIRIEVQEVRGLVRTIILIRDGGARTILEGYERMNKLLEHLCQYSDAEISRTSRWLGL